MHNLRGHNYVNRYFTLSRQSPPFVCRIPEIRFDSVVLQSTRCGIANPPPPQHPKRTIISPHGKKSHPSLPPFLSLPRLIIGQISISGRHLFPIPESGRPMEPVRPVPLGFRAGQINIFAIKHSAGSLQSASKEREREGTPDYVFIASAVRATDLLVICRR